MPTIETLEKFARALDVLLYMLYYDGEEPPKLKNLFKGKTADEFAFGSTRKEAKVLTRLRRLPTKTKAAKASVPVLSVLAKHLEAHRNGFPLDGFIFAGPKKGLPLDLHNLYARGIKDKLKEAKISWAGWHGFRRGLATTLYKLGTDPKTRRGILRRAKIAVTDEIYTQSVDSISRVALRKVEKLFGPKRKVS